MTATATTTARTLRINWTATPLDTTVLSLTVTEGKRVDGYHAFHEVDSCEIDWTHDDEPTRSYTVVCSASTGLPVRCSCPGFQYGRGKVCRHMAASAVLIRRGAVVLPRLVDAGCDRGGVTEQDMW